MVSPPNLVAEDAAEPHRAQAEDQLGGDVDERQEVLAVAPEVHRLVTKAGEGREPAQDADEDEGARIGGEGAPGLGELRQQADDEAPEDVDGERADREVVAPGPFLDEPAQQVAKDGSNEPADADEQDVAHAAASGEGSSVGVISTRRFRA